MGAKRLLQSTLLASVLIGASLPTGIAVADAAEFDRDAGARPVSVIHLSIDGPGGPEDYRTTLLTCRPSGGTHPTPQAACDDLAAANGDFEALPDRSEGAICPLVYRPLTVRARGAWSNRVVNYEHTFPNKCVMRATVGPVFEF